ncbi:hypothetical protein PQQ88_30345 [Paraburkholderia caledonica]|jgi:hypothetical protein|uniref:hypothetical protein n=1 Tax=Paraburkholderia TaxID=1822464 RepID=UPI0038B94DCC
MRMFIAALPGAAALLPTLVLATTTLPDPADAAASVPAVSVPSVFADYQPFRDQKAPTWQELNRAVTTTPGKPGMGRGQMPSGVSGAKNNEHSSHHEEPAK